MLQLILLMGSARAPGSPSPPSTRPGEAVPGGTRQLPPASSPARGAHAIPRSRNVRSIFGPLCSHREQTGGCDPRGAGADAAAAPSRFGKAARCLSPDPSPGAELEPRSRARPCPSERPRGSRPQCLCLTTALMVGMRGFKATVFRGVFPKESRGCFPVTLDCDIPGVPGRDSPTPSQLCRAPLDADSRSGYKTLHSDEV